MNIPPRPARRHIPSRALLVSAVTVALTASAVVGAASAQAASTWPGKPSGVRVSAAGSSWFTVSANRSAHARTYTLFASTYKPDLYYAHLVHGRKSSARRTTTSSRPALTIAGLRYSAAPIYYRIVARNGRHKASYSAGINVTALRPSTPTSLVAHSSATSTYLTWNSGAATGFTVALGTNPSLTAGRRNYVVNDVSHEFTPYGLSTGTRYYATVRAWNGSMPSGWASPTSMVVTSHEQTLRILTYNILHMSFDGTRERGGIVAPWSQRRVAAANLIKSVNPDVFGVQEAGAYTTRAYNYLQVDSLRSALASAGVQYTKAHTEASIGTSAFLASGGLRTGNYILYKPSVYRALGYGGYWTLATNVYAVYQLLQNVRTGAKLLVVNTHLTQPGGHGNDVLRQSETRTMVSHASALSATQHAPAVYIGDYNSNTNYKQYTFDGPGSVMRASHVADARLSAQAKYNQQYDTMNNYMRSPFHYGLDIDYIWMPAGISASSWGVAMQMSHGRQVGVIPSDHFPIWATLHVDY